MRLIEYEKKNDSLWDEVIKKYQSKHFFHQECWLNYIKESQTGKILKLTIIDDDGKVLGYFSGLLIKKGPIKILGSPLPGWGTNYMGPLIDDAFNQSEFLNALDKYCSKNHIHHVEISNPLLNRDLMIKNGYKCQKGMTSIVDLSNGEGIVWKSFTDKCRNSIRKAMKSGLVSVIVNPDEMVDAYYSQLIEVFGKQKLVPTYSKDRLKILCKTISKDNILAIMIKHNETSVATGYFLYDEQRMYFFGGASWLEYQYLCPNDLLHWTAMQYAIEKGIKSYDFSGGGYFKKKYNGKIVEMCHYYKSFVPMIIFIRKLYKTLCMITLKIKGMYCYIGNTLIRR